MSHSSIRSGLLFAVIPLLLLIALPSTGSRDAVSARGGDEVRLELASLKSEARSMTLHIDGP
jgi:hypothetical protein